MTVEDTIEAAPGAAAQHSGYWSRVAHDPKLLGFWMTLPVVALLVFIVVFPFLMQLYLSLTWWTPLDGVPWYMAYRNMAWWEQYYELLTDGRLWGSILRTLLIMAIAVPLEFVFGLGLAYLFIDPFPGRKIFYSILLTPMMVVPAVVGLIFFLCFQGSGPINHMLGFPANYSWLTDPNRALVSVIAADVWQWTPLMFLILLAGMLGVPQDQLMAARLLGGSNWQNFFKIIIPRMKTVIIIAIVLRSVECFKIFDLISIMTKGGPGVQTETISMYLYKLTFADLEWAYVAAVGLFVLVVLSILASFGLKAMAKKA